MADQFDENNHDEVKINLSYFSGTGSVWNTKDWRKILEYRVNGRFVGNLAQQCHQVKEMGFPLLLSRNETTLLLEMNAAVLNYPNHLIQQPSDEMKRKYQEFRKHSFSRQVTLLKEQRKLEILDKADSIITGKLSKRPRMSEPSSIEKDLILQEELSKIQDPPEGYLLEQICTGKGWDLIKRLKCFPEDQFHENLDWKPVIWKYPETEQDKLEYATYRSLHALGFWITGGAKFGGNFLAYPGSPILFHAQYIIRCVLNLNLTPASIVAFGRVAHSTRKVPVLAYKNRKNEIAFQSIAWLD